MTTILSITAASAAPWTGRRPRMHQPSCEFLRPDGIACTCGAFRRHLTAPDSYCRIHGPASDDNLERRAQLVHREDHEGHGCSFDPKQRPAPGTVGTGPAPRLDPGGFIVTRGNAGAAGIVDGGGAGGRADGGYVVGGLKGAMAQGRAIAEAEQRRSEREFCTCDEYGGAARADEHCPVHGTSTLVRLSDGTLKPQLEDEDKGVPINDPDRPTDHYAAQIAQHAIDLFTGDRNADYGDATDNFQDIADLWSVVLRPILQPGTAITAEQAAIMQGLIKVARLNNSPNHDDSWVDATAYLALGGGIVRRRLAR